MNSRQCKSLLAAWMVGEGIITLLFPSRFYGLWSSGPGWRLGCVEALSERPGLVRAIGLVEFLIGCWLTKEHVAER